MGWSSNAPSGVTFSSTTKKTDDKTWNYYSAYHLNVWTARGAGNTYYVKVTVNWREGQSGTYQKDNNGIYWFVGSDKQNFAMPSSIDNQTKYYTGTMGASGSVTVGVSPNANLSNAAEVNSASIPAAAYAVTYNANGGTGAPAAQTKKYNVSLTLRTAVPTRANYNFVKWNTKADGTGTDYAAGAVYTGNAALKLYAVWEIGYAINLSSGTVTTPGSQAVSINNGYEMTAEVTVTDGNGHTLYSGTTDTGSVTVAVDKTWFDTAGVITEMSFTATVTVVIDGITLTETFTVSAGPDAFPVIGTPTISPVNSGNAQTYFPTAFIAGVSRIKAEVEITTPTDAELVTKNLTVGSETVTLSYNSDTGKYEGTTSGTVTIGAGYSIIAADERGITAVASAQILGIQSYSPPVVNVEASGTYRCDSNGDKDIKGRYYKAKALAVYTALTGNALLTFEVKKRGEALGTALASGVQSGVLGGSLSQNTSETLDFVIEDKVSAPITFPFILKAPTKAITVSHDAGGTRVDLPEGGKYMISGVDILEIIYPVGSIYISSDSTDPGTLLGGTWNQLSARFMTTYYVWERTA